MLTLVLCYKLYYLCVINLLFNNHDYVVQAEIISDVTDLLENETLSSTFTCLVVGEPVPNISWYFNDVTLFVLNSSKYQISNSINGTMIESFLTIMSVQSSDVGKYTCHAENIVGMDQSSGILTVNGKWDCKTGE